MKLITTGRTDLNDFFGLSGIREWEELSHTPALAFIESKDEIKVEIISKPHKLLDLPDKTKIMMQWKGQWRSDFFHFTVEELKNYIKNNPKKDYYNI